MIITQTPLRISFAGGGTDLAGFYERDGGLVVSAAIDKFAMVIVTARYDDKIYVNYSRKEIVDSVDELQHELVRESMRLTGVTGGVEVTMLSDIPSEGSGLGSSSSFTVGLLNAFHVFQGEQAGPAQLAEEACEIEIVRCQKPIGKQDQYIAAFGGVRSFEFRPDGTVGVERLPLDSRELRRFASNLFLFYTEQTRSANAILAEQSERTEQHRDELSQIRELAVLAQQGIRSGDYECIGEILARNWQLKKQLASQITNSRIDEMQTTAMEAGATGAKICGAGGGGFLLVYCPTSAQDRLLAAMARYRQMPFLFEPDGSKVIFNYRRSTWN
jgi:D-glycero-alpha-D-manno-heptose-7-phosphate kinase